ncbi:hypothetical protein GCM10027447_18430 [Glycomyces halotolerans]
MPVPSATLKPGSYWTVSISGEISSNTDISARDREILTYLVAAPDQQTAAEWLGMTVRHLRRRIGVIMDRLGAENAYQMVALAALRGLIDPKALPAGTMQVD